MPSPPCYNSFFVQGSSNEFKSISNSVLKPMFSNGELFYKGPCPSVGDLITAAKINDETITTTFIVAPPPDEGAKNVALQKKIQSSPPSSHLKEINNFLLNAANKFTEFNILFKCPINKKISARRKNENAEITNLYERHFAHFQ